MTETDVPVPDDDAENTNRRVDRRTQRDVDLHGRNLIAAGRAAAAAGDAGAARALLGGAAGSQDPTVASEAAAALANVDAEPPRRVRRTRGS